MSARQKLLSFALGAGLMAASAGAAFADEETTTTTPPQSQGTANQGSEMIPDQVQRTTQQQTPQGAAQTGTSAQMGQMGQIGPNGPTGEIFTVAGTIAPVP